MENSEGNAGRKRKPNFSSSEVNILTESVEKNLNTLQSKFTNTITNKKKNLIWEEIAQEVNAVAVSKRTVQDVKDKWKNLTSKAKKEFSSYKRESVKTGGGPPPKRPTEATEKIISLFEDSPSFTGLQGFDSGEFQTIDVEVLNIATAAEPTEQAAVQPAPDDAHEIKITEVTVDNHKSVKSINRKKVTTHDVMEAQLEAIALKRENLLLKKKKLQLQIELLERQVASEIVPDHIAF